MTELWVPEWDDPHATVLYGGYKYEPQPPYCLVYSGDGEFVEQFYNLHLAVYSHFEKNVESKPGAYSFILDADMHCVFGWSWPPVSPRPHVSRNHRIPAIIADLTLGDPLLALYEESIR